ncbi:MAG: hypothetical protein ACFFCQ_03050 [Promethearchaeota archaeon]
MTITTRRITEKELTKLKEVQSILEATGIKLSQAEISELVTEFTLENFDEFLVTIRTKFQEKKRDPLFEWLDTPVEGKIKTNSVKEHDVTR